MKNELYDKYDLRVARVLWFTFGFVAGTVSTLLIFTYGNY